MLLVKVNLSMASAFNNNTSIFADQDNTLKVNAQGQKPYKYRTQNFGTAPSDGGNLSVGNRGVAACMCSAPIPAPTRLNEISAGYKFPVNAAYLGSEHASLKNIDAHSDLRWGGNIRCNKSQQLVSEENYGRTNFYAPEANESDKPFIAVDLDISRGDGLVVPNYKLTGNNAVNIRSVPTRNDRIIVQSQANI